MQILRSENYKRMPWKNGGGETKEIVAYPPDASIDRFLWRVSMASVAVDGPFSKFDDVDRSLCILGGEAIRLTVSGKCPVLLTPDSEPYRFRADAPASVSLPNGPITDLNVMTNRNYFRHLVTRIRGVSHVKVTARDKTTVITLPADSCTIDGSKTEVHAFEAVIVEPGEVSIPLLADHPTDFIVIEIRSI